MNYACNEYKSILGSEPHFLMDREEARDVLENVSIVGGRCIASFLFGPVVLPKEVAPKLRHLIGHKIGCLSLDGHVHVRDLEAEDATV